MSFTMGPCPRCGLETLYASYTPTPCFNCNNKELRRTRQDALVPSSGPNRQERRKQKALARKNDRP